MRPGAIVILHVFANDPLQRLLPEDEDMIQTFQPYTPLESFANGIRLGRTIRRLRNFNGHAYGDPLEGLPIFTISIPN